MIEILKELGIFELLKELGYVGFIIVVVSTIVYFIVKKYIERLFLAHQNNIERLFFEYQTKFSLLHKTRAEIVAELYAKMMAMERAMALHLGMQESGTEEPIKEDARLAGEAFMHFYQDREVWFSKEICDELYALKDKMWEAFKTKKEAGEEGRPEGYETSRKAFMVAVDEIRPKIRTQFRQLLGVK